MRLTGADGRDHFCEKACTREKILEPLPGVKLRPPSYWKVPRSSENIKKVLVKIISTDTSLKSWFCLQWELSSRRLDSVNSYVPLSDFIIIIIQVSTREYGKMYLHFTEILTTLLMGDRFRTSGLTLNPYVPLSDLCERRIVIIDWLSVKLKTNRSWTSLATWVVPPFLYLATLTADSEGGSRVKITSTSSRGAPSRVYVHRRVMLSFSTGYNGLEGVEIKDGACSLRKRKQKSQSDKLIKWV